MKILQIRVATAVTIITNIVTRRERQKKKKERKKTKKKKHEYNFSEGNFPFSLSALIQLTVTQ